MLSSGASALTPPDQARAHATLWLRRAGAGRVLRRVRRSADWLRYRVNQMPVSPLVAPACPTSSEALFHDIALVPPKWAYRFGHAGQDSAICCGPVLPDTGVEPWMRHCVHNFVCDRVPEQPAEPLDRIDRPAVWLGYMHMPFGHLVAEHLTRALWSRTERPDDLYLFAMSPGTRPAFHFLDLLAWYGLPPGQLRQITAPVVAADLRIYPQAELLDGAGPAGEYLDLLDLLDLLDRHVAASGLRPIPRDLVFVTRAGMLGRRTGSHAGEAYLVRQLRQAGVAVIDPAVLPLGPQLRAYAGARRLVFSEGSALHGRQLLGRLDQDIVVLNRRPGARIAVSALTPRCRSLTYAEVCRTLAEPQTRRGLPVPSDGLSFYDLPALWDAFAGLGIDLRRRWDDAAYRDAVVADMRLWREGLATGGRDYDPAGLEALARSSLSDALGDSR